MRRLFLVFLLSVTPLPLLAATISGTVSQSGPGTALAGMTVQAYDTGGVLRGTAVSDGTGRYTLTLAAGTYRVLAFDPAGIYATSFYDNANSFEGSMALILEATLQNVNLSLVRGGFIAGVITASGGLPSASITVSAYNLDGSRRGFTTTDATGRYRLVLPPGSYVLAAYDDAQNYLTRFYSNASEFANATALPVVATQTTAADITLPRGATVEGTVTDAITRAVIAGARIAVYRDGLIVATGSTDAAGRFRLLLPPGTYRFVIFDPNGIYAAVFVTGAESFDTSTLFVLGASETRTIDTQLTRGGRLSGRITEAFTSTGLAGITVAAFNADGTTRGFTTTDALGNYVLILPPGSYRVGAFDTGLTYLKRFSPGVAAFRSSLPSSVFASQATTVDLQLPRGAVVTGQVQSSLAALAGITIAAYDGTGLSTATVTDGTGHYRLLLEPGSYTITAYDPGFRYATVGVGVTVGFGQVLTDFNFSLVIGAHVSGVVLTSAGTPVPDLTVAAYGADGNPILMTSTRFDGRFDLVVPPGSYRFAAYDSLQRFYPSAQTTVFTVSASQVVGGLELRVAPRAISRRRAAVH